MLPQGFKSSQDVPTLLSELEAAVSAYCSAASGPTKWPRLVECLQQQNRQMLQVSQKLLHYSTRNAATMHLQAPVHLHAVPTLPRPHKINAGTMLPQKTLDESAAESRSTAKASADRAAALQQSLDAMRQRLAAAEVRAEHAERMLSGYGHFKKEKCDQEPCSRPTPNSGRSPSSKGPKVSHSQRFLPAARLRGGLWLKRSKKLVQNTAREAICKGTELLNGFHRGTSSRKRTAATALHQRNTCCLG